MTTSSCATEPTTTIRAKAPASLSDDERLVAGGGLPGDLLPVAGATRAEDGLGLGRFPLRARGHAALVVGVRGGVDRADAPRVLLVVIGFRQWPVARASRTPPTNRPTTSAAKAAGRTARRQGAGVSTRRARGTGQAATQERHPKHSSERTRASLATGRRDGQAFVHRLQSMQEAACRVTLSGESSESAPSSAPYGQR